MKKGFTLIEALIVIIILGLIIFEIYPMIDHVIEKSEKKSYEETISNLENAAHLYGTENELEYTSIEKPIKFRTLLQSGYIKELPSNPYTNNLLSGCIMYKWTGTQFDFRYDAECE